ncbi:MAG TPA: hypothetical protein PLS69_14280, partial [Terricaulis sp.]|nr:hypothetical protein [Terricaulis sp.]
DRGAEGGVGHVPRAYAARVSGEREVIFEILRVGDVQRVAAVDVESGLEVVIVAPANAAQADVQTLALRKLERALAGEAGEDEAPPRGRGKLV